MFCTRVSEQARGHGASRLVVGYLLGNSIEPNRCRVIKSICEETGDRSRWADIACLINPKDSLFNTSSDGDNDQEGRKMVMDRKTCAAVGTADTWAFRDRGAASGPTF